jgi:ribose 1,5-bisphosphokinase
MSWLAKARRWLANRSPLIGPGRLVLVVGPSGAGKDTLIGHARAACRDDASVVFPRRTVTRPASTFENNDPMSEDAFRQSAAAGAFAFWWSAHDHLYGIPSSIDHEIAAGRTVVCNVSRTAVDAARRRYAHVVVVLVTAPEEILLQRLVFRNRTSDASISERMKRSTIIDGNIQPDVVINNVGGPERGACKLLDAMYATGVFVA